MAIFQDKPFLLGRPDPIFSGKLALSFREGSHVSNPNPQHSMYGIFTYIYHEDYCNQM